MWAHSNRRAQQAAAGGPPQALALAVLGGPGCRSHRKASPPDPSALPPHHSAGGVMVAEPGFACSSLGPPHPGRPGRRSSQDAAGHSEDPCLSCTGEGRIPGAPAPHPDPRLSLGPTPQSNRPPVASRSRSESAGARTHGLWEGDGKRPPARRGEGTPGPTPWQILPGAAASSASASLPRRTPTQRSPGEMRQDGWEFGPAWAIVTKPSV